MSDPTEPIQASDPETAQEISKIEPEENAIVPVVAEKSDEVTTTIVVKKKKRRPARVQKEPGTVQDQLPQSGTVFNIWYLKWSGGDKDDKFFSQRKSEGRCVIATDAGYTKADKTPGATFFCLYFARGLCTRGKNCEYLHRLPTITDIFPPNLDCFGRDKFSDYRDDMGGVGSFLKQNRTIYVGRIPVTDDIDELVAKNFAEWGEIERTRVLNSRGVAFVTYSNEANAQFAKEAMAHQSLNGDEVLNVRWATDDPNPLAKVREKRRLEEQAADAIRKLLPAEYVAEIEGKDPEARKRRKEDSSFGLEGYEAPDDIWFARGHNSVNPNAKTTVSSTNHKTIQIPMDQNTQEVTTVESPKQIEAAPLQPSTGLFSSASLATLQKVSQLTSKISAPPVTVPAVTPPVGLGLSAYDSDDDDE